MDYLQTCAFNFWQYHIYSTVSATIGASYFLSFDCVRRYLKTGIPIQLLRMNSSNGVEFDQEHSNFEEHKDLDIGLCFEIIFPYLEVNDLVNVADSCRQMKKMAESTFHQKYAKKWLFTLKPSRLPPKHTVQTHNQIEILNQKTCYGFIRCFGHMVLDLKLNYDQYSSMRSPRLNEYIAKYCIFLTEIEFSSNFRRPSAETVILFMDSCESLKKIIFRPINSMDFKKLIGLLNKRQNISTSIDEKSPLLKVICKKY